ncbi:gluconeogenesis factor YvcK family protein [Atopococcus tabaci]|uniref:gluconeogenesis factor YvcK family protein n=1 Tax=Atopococcus tabaci TaxID=269774 RepID=UPI0003FDDD56|nr:gluconeogenesis factor YvcK family protein [Atopococcus tabaci]
MMNNKNHRKPKIVVIGGGTGLPVILQGLKEQQADVTAIVTVADDGGSSGALRESVVHSVPPGDIRNVLVALSDIPKSQKEIFQYRFHKEDASFAGHSLGNLIIAAMAEMKGNIYEAIQLLSKMMMVEGHVYPAAEEPLVLHAEYTDGTRQAGESQIPKARKKIKRVFVTPAEENQPLRAGRKVISSILNADMVVLGPGSLYTSILPNLMIPDLGQAVVQTDAQVVYICNIMTQLGETENFSDADHIRVLHEHLGTQFVDTILANIGEVPENYIGMEEQEEYLVQVSHNFDEMKQEVPYIISDNFLQLKEKGVYHNGEKVAAELFKLALENQRHPRKSTHSHAE